MASGWSSVRFMRCFRWLLASLRDAFSLGEFSGGVGRGGLYHRLQILYPFGITARKAALGERVGANAWDAFDAASPLVTSCSSVPNGTPGFRSPLPGTEVPGYDQTFLRNGRRLHVGPVILFCALAALALLAVPVFAEDEAPNTTDAEVYKAPVGEAPPVAPPLRKDSPLWHLANDPKYTSLAPGYREACLIRMAARVGVGYASRTRDGAARSG
jgi:hypothetical protein